MTSIDFAKAPSSKSPIPKAPRIAAAAALALIAASSAHAQRGHAKTEWQGRKFDVEFGVVRVGKHGVDELQPGTTWRMGNNTASSLLLEAPLVAGDLVVAPGGYRVNVGRPSKDDFTLQIDGAGMALSPKGGGGAVTLPGKLGKPEKPSATIEATVKPVGKAAPPNEELKYEVVFGASKLEVQFTMLGTKTVKQQGWICDAFAFPAEGLAKRLDSGALTPIACFRRDAEDKKSASAFNLLVSKTEALLVPHMRAPTDNFGFGEVKGPVESELVTATSVKWDDAKDKKSTLELEKFEVAKGKGFLFTATCGDKTCVVAMPDPAAPKTGQKPAN